jgi:hypothetical protein
VLAKPLSCKLVCVLLRTRHPQVGLLRQLHGCVPMRIGALGRGVKSNVRRFGSGLGRGVVVRVRQAAVVTAWTGYGTAAEAVSRVVYRSACLANAVGRSWDGSKRFVAVQCKQVRCSRAQRSGGRRRQSRMCLARVRVLAPFYKQRWRRWIAEWVEGSSLADTRW